MRIFLVTLNAKYIHAALGIHVLKAYAERHGFEVHVREYTINQDLGWIHSHIMRQEPDILGFSCNIWNVAETKALIRRIKKVDPGLPVLVGGPEFSCTPEDFLKDTGADFGIVGEGEKAFLHFLQVRQSGGSYHDIMNLVWRDGEAIRRQDPGTPIVMDELPFPYTDEFLGEPGRIIYYETTRGCPFACAYCLSGGEKGLRKRGLDKVFADLDKLVRAGIRQVKFVDRTFNADPRRCEAILTYIIEHYADSGVNFHMELVAELLDEELMTVLNRAPYGLFRSEVGIQSLHAPTLEAVHRPVSPERLEKNLRRLMQPGNIPVHLDLIAGLPYEGWDEFARTFDWTFHLRPAEIQLGILKMLKGSELGRKGSELGYIFTEEAPYEIMTTPWLSFVAIQRLKTMAHLVEILYNAGHFTHAIPFLLAGEGRSPFHDLDQLVSRWEKEALDISPPALGRIFDFLLDSIRDLLPTGHGQAVAIDLLRLDRALADWSQEHWSGWGTAPDLPKNLQDLLTNESWVLTQLPPMAGLKPSERRRRVRRLLLGVNPQNPANGPDPTEVVLFRPLRGRAGYVILEDKG